VPRSRHATRLAKADFALAAHGGALLASPEFKNCCVSDNAHVLAFNIDGGALFEQMLMRAGQESW
jgi:hypothetical protein